MRTSPVAPLRRGRRGYTLVELLLALVLVALAGSWFLNAPRPVPAYLAGDVARRVRAMLATALAEAERDGRDVEVRADASVAGDRRGRFRALAVPAGSAGADDPGAEWIDLVQGVMWSAGGAARDPAGAATDGAVPGTVRCTPAACETGGRDYVVYYIGHARAPRVAFAVVLTRGRDVWLYRWDDATHTWRGDAT
jgi:prepilin-type N-terminal cleavage/methylation domain-containing protein